MDISELSKKRLNNVLKTEYFNPTIHGNISYFFLKKNLYDNMYSTKYTDPFPITIVSTKKQLMINRMMASLPTDVIRIIKEYAFYKADEFYYSMVYLPQYMRVTISRNVIIKESLSRMSVARNQRRQDECDDEEWSWISKNVWLIASNCHKCGGYTTSKVDNLTPKVICHCV